MYVWCDYEYYVNLKEQLDDNQQTKENMYVLGVLNITMICILHTFEFIQMKLSLYFDFLNM